MSVSIVKSQVPDLSEWTEEELVECIGTPDEHADKFYRWCNYGIEVHDDGKCQAYVIIRNERGEEEPQMVKEGLDSPEAVIEFFKEQNGTKALSESTPANCEGGNGSESPGMKIEITVSAGDTGAKDIPKEESKMTDTKETESVVKSTDIAKPAVPTGTDTTVQVQNAGQSTAAKPATTQKETLDTKELKCSSSGLNETLAHSGTVQEANSSGHVGGDQQETITSAGTVEEAQASGHSERKLDANYNAKPVDLPAAKTEAYSAPVLKSFSEMMQERQLKKSNFRAGNPTAQDTEYRKESFEKSMKLKLGTDKDEVEKMPKLDQKDHANAEGAVKKSYSLPSFEEMHSFMKSADYIPGTVGFNSFAKAEEPKKDDGAEPKKEGGADPKATPAPPAAPPSDGMPPAGGDGLPDEPPAEVPADDGVPPAEGEVPGAEVAGSAEMAPEEVAQLYAAADDVTKAIVVAILTDTGDEGAPAPEGGAAPEDVLPPETANMGAGGIVPPESSTGSDMVSGSDVNAIDTVKEKPQQPNI